MCCDVSGLVGVSHGSIGGPRAKSSRCQNDDPAPPCLVACGATEIGSCKLFLAIATGE